MKRRDLEDVIKSVPASDGAGVSLKRILDQRMDPFLMLDEIKAGNEQVLGNGFPSHPHRGIETISCMLVGGFRHEDHMGNRREVKSGGMQWMTAGRGVIHSEMPLPEQGRLHGFQLWLNLPAKKKMTPPSYLDVQPEDILVAPLPGGQCRVLAGSIVIDGSEYKGAVERGITSPLVLDIQLDQPGQLALPVPLQKLMVYVYQGSLTIAGEKPGTVAECSLGILGDGEELSVTNNRKTGFLLLGGAPLNEPVVQHGPFVMNSREEIDQAIKDYREGTLI